MPGPVPTLAEILTVPAKVGDRMRFPNLEVAPLDVTLARETALARAVTGLRPPDAIQAAAARLAGGRDGCHRRQ